MAAVEIVTPGGDEISSSELQGKCVTPNGALGLDEVY